MKYMEMIMNGNQLNSTENHFFISLEEMEEIFLYLPNFENKSDAMNDNMLSDTTSPIEAAKGVARLSGFK